MAKIKSKKTNSNRLTILTGILLTLVLAVFVTMKISMKNKEISQLSNSTMSQPTLNSGDIFTSPLIDSLVKTSNQENAQRFYFTLNVPKNWAVEKYEKDDKKYILTLKKDNSTLSLIMPEIYDGTFCNFQNPSTDSMNGMYYPYFDEVATNFGTVRMARRDLNSYDENIQFYGCQVFPNSKLWNSITKIGLVSFSIPKSEYNNASVKEIENILKQIKVTYITN